VPDEAVHELFDVEFVDWCLSQPELVFDVESNVETGDSLVVARRGIGLEGSDLEVLLQRAEHLVDRFSRGPVPGPPA